MRVPINKIYRAFPELDAFSDEQCERFMRRIEVSGPRRYLPTLAFGVIFIGGLLLACPLSAMLVSIIDQNASGSLTNRYGVLIDLGPLLVAFGVPAALGLIARDYLLRRHLRLIITDKLNRIRCLACKYILIGQVVSDDAVTCPECGRWQLLSELGVEEADLIPSTNRDGPVRSA